MYTRILLLAIFVTLFGRAAHAGVMVGIDWDSGSVMAASDSDTMPPELPVRFEEGSPASSMGVSVSASVPTLIAALSVPGSFSFAPILVGVVQPVDGSIPPAPILDGLLKPA